MKCELLFALLVPSLFSYVNSNYGLDKSNNEDKYSEAEIKLFSNALNMPSKSSINEILELPNYKNNPYLAYLNLGKYCLQINRVDKAVINFKRAIEQQPKVVEPYILLGQAVDPASPKSLETRATYLLTALQIDSKNIEANILLANLFWEARAWDLSLEHFENAFELGHTPNNIMVIIIYLRCFVAKWGESGAGFRRDMNRLESLIRHEINTTMRDATSLHQASAVHPHMTLGFLIDPVLKLAVAKSHSDAEIVTLHCGLRKFKCCSIVLLKNAGGRVFDHKPLLPQYRKESQKKGFRLRVGYVSANIKSKTTVYMAQDLWRFHNRTNFEVHVFATNGPDDPDFLQISMRGVDWRKKVQDSVEYFHDCSKMSVFELAELIRSHQIHILLNWDGYSNAGGRATGLFPMKISPLQLGHQEYIGTMGASYIQYIVTDKVASPQQQEHIYTEKFIYMPYSFLANSMPHMRPHMKRPQLVLSKQDNPQRNGCGGKPASFVYCNFNKHLKFSPHVFLSWLQTLEAVDGSILCLLENPKHSKTFIQSFVREYSSKLEDRVRFQPFLPNPYDNQHRNARFCSVVLDTEVYNGHTTAVDALWAGVGASILSAIGLTQLITKDLEDYNTVSRKLGLDSEFYRSTRNQLVEACLATSPRNPYWDIQRYVRDMEQGFTLIWNNFLEGREPQHVEVKDIGPIVDVQSKKTSKRSSKSSNKIKNHRRKSRYSAKKIRNKSKKQKRELKTKKAGKSNLKELKGRKRPMKKSRLHAEF